MPLTLGSKTLRDYQEAAYDTVTASLVNGVRRALFTLPTGTGKTLVFCALVNALNRPGRPALILVNRKELIAQAIAELLETDPSLAGHIGTERAASRAAESCRVVVGSIQTLVRGSRLQWLADLGPSVVIYDEGHHAPSPGSVKVLTRFGCMNGRTPLVGCTATPVRLDKKEVHGNDGVFEQLVYGDFTLIEAIRAGWLVDLRGYAVRTEVDLNAIQTKAGDFKRSQLARMVDVTARTEKVIGHWEEVAQGRQTIAFCAGKEHAVNTAAMWRARGYTAEAVYSEGVKPWERDEIIARFKRGETQILTNVEVLTEGFDHDEVGCVVMLRPTKSWALYIQMIGRGTRLPKSAESDKRDCIVIDAVDNYKRHSIVRLPTVAGLNGDVDLQGKSLMQAKAVADRAGGRTLKGLTFCEIVTELEEIELAPPVVTRQKRGTIVIGETYGNWTVTGKERGKGHYRSRCPAGHEVIKTATTLHANQECRACKSNAITIGKTYGAWTVTSKKRGKGVYICRCLAGHESVRQATEILDNRCCKACKGSVIVLGQVYGAWAAIAKKGRQYLCRCPAMHEAWKQRAGILKNQSCRTCQIEAAKERRSRSVTTNL